jgi:hypothetical protein
LIAKLKSVSAPLISAETAFLISVRPLAPTIENWKSSQVSWNTAPFQRKRLSAQVVFQPNS